MEYPDLRVLLLTYNRLQYAEITIRSLLENMRYSGHIFVHIADDGTSEEYRNHLIDVAGAYKNVYGVSQSSSERGGYGKNYNVATQIIHRENTDLVLPLEDDWRLERELDIDSFLGVFLQEPLSSIRLGYLGWTQPLLCSPVIIDGKFYLSIDPMSPEPHVFSGHPRLETVAWERRLGLWPEGLNPGQTEFTVAHIPEARQGILWPCDIHPRGDMFSHIGTERSY